MYWSLGRSGMGSVINVSVDHTCNGEIYADRKPQPTYLSLFARCCAQQGIVLCWETPRIFHIVWELILGHIHLRHTQGSVLCRDRRRQVQGCSLSTLWSTRTIHLVYMSMFSARLSSLGCEVVAFLSSHWLGIERGLGWHTPVNWDMWHMCFK